MNICFLYAMMLLIFLIDVAFDCLVTATDWSRTCCTLHVVITIHYNTVSRIRAATLGANYENPYINVNDEYFYRLLITILLLLITINWLKCDRLLTLVARL